MRQSPRHPLQQALTVLAAATVTALTLQAPEGMADSAAHPTLTQATPGVVSSGGIANLRNSLIQLHADNAERNIRPTGYQRQHDALQSALRQLSSPDRVAATSTPRLGRSDYINAATEPQSLAALAASLLAIRKDAPVTNVAQVGTVNDLRRAMGRFPTVTDTLLSDTFSGVLLGLADIEPTLSDGLMTHPTVNKQALRERVVEARLPMAGPVTAGIQLAQTAPRLSQPSSEPVVAPAQVPVPDDAMLAGLDQPIDTIALGGTMAAPQSGWDTIASPEEELIAMEDTVDLDQIDLDELGAADIASATVPVGTDDLQETRAGYELPNGIVVEFAVQRVSAVNGLDGLLSVANIPGLDASTLSQISGKGTANTQILSPNSGGGSLITQIQNSLDNQQITSFTVIDIGIKNLGLKPSEFLQSTNQTPGIPAELR